MSLQQKRYILILLFMISFIGLVPYSNAQDDQKQKNEKEFNDFQSRITNNFGDFKDKNDSIFLQFLEASWKEFQLFREDNKVRVKPAEQPIVGNVKGNTEEPPVKKSIQDNQKINQPERDPPGQTIPDESSEPIMPAERPDIKSGINFFGQPVEFPAINDLPSASTISNTEIIDYYKSYQGNKSLAQSIEVITQFSLEKSLNDWGYLYLLIDGSKYYYQKMNDRVLFVWMTLLKRGFDVKIGHDAKNVYLLVNFKNRIFNKMYVNILNQRYYVYTFPQQTEPQDELNSYETVYSQEVKAVSLMVYNLPGLNGQTGFRKILYARDAFSISLTLPLIEYMNAYPDCELPVYFIAPASEKAMKSMDKLILPLLTGKSEIDKVSAILNFVQLSIPYKTDEQQFGKENYLFADETLYYPGSDCEDRAILLSKLVERYTGLTTIGLDYPEHVSLGIKFTKPIQGDFVTFNGEKYYICDPTYIGAKIGMAMDFMKNQNPQIIQTSQKN